tara:strand:- start:55 stop:258 length:204 start_codon:yes stop_codon:yes gene_type:complete
MTKDKKPKWDGKSRVSNDLYRKRYDEIFKKVTDDNAEEFVHGRKDNDDGNPDWLKGYNKWKKESEKK